MREDKRMTCSDLFLRKEVFYLKGVMGMAESTPKTRGVLVEKQLKLLEELVSSVRHGTVTLVIQDGRVIQLEKHEKYRLV